MAGEPFSACLYSGYSTTAGGLFDAAFPCCVFTQGSSRLSNSKMCPCLLGLELITTGFRFFAECLRHSAKAKLHLAKPLPSAALSKEHTAKNWSAKPSLPSVFYRALGKEKRPSRRRPRWQSFCQVPTLQALGKDYKISLPSANPSGTRQRFFIFFKKKLFAECPLSGPRQRCFIYFLKILCRVPPGRRSAKFEFF